MNTEHNNTMNTENSCCCEILHRLSCIFCYLIAGVLFPTLLYLITPNPSPSFTLHDVKLYAFNFSTATSTLNSTLQINISCRNTGYNTLFQFDELEVYASYKNQPITPPTTLHPTYLVEPEVWSLYLIGTEVPVTPDLAASLAQDETAGKVLINVEVTGQLSSMSSYSGSSGFGAVPPVSDPLKVNCLAYIMFGDKNDSNVVGSAVKHPFVEVEGCHDEL